MNAMKRFLASALLDDDTGRPLGWVVYDRERPHVLTWGDLVRVGVPVPDRETEEGYAVMGSRATALRVAGAYAETHGKE